MAESEGFEPSKRRCLHEDSVARLGDSEASGLLRPGDWRPKDTGSEFCPNEDEYRGNQGANDDSIPSAPDVLGGQHVHKARPEHMAEGGLSRRFVSMHVDSMSQTSSPGHGHRLPRTALCNSATGRKAKTSPSGIGHSTNTTSSSSSTGWNRSGQSEWRA